MSSSSPYPRKREETPSAEDLLADLNRPLPHDSDAERGILSALMQKVGTVNECRQSLLPEAFYVQANRIIFEELLTMDEEGLQPDPLMLNSRLREQGKTDAVGGPSTISEIYRELTVHFNFKNYLASVLDKWRLRRAIHGYALGLRILQNHGKEDPSAKAQESVNDAARSVQVYTESLTAKGGTTATLTECLFEHADHMQALQERLLSGQDALIPTGFPSLDELAGGIGRDEYWLLTGPTKSGKTVAATCIARHAASRSFKVKYYSAEVARRTLAGRMIAGESRILDGKIERCGIKTRQEWDAYSSAMTTLQREIGKIFKVDNAAGKYVEDLIADMRMEAEEGTQLVVVDLIGKIRTRQRFNTREQELAHISLSIYEATKNYGIAAIVLAQENEDGQARDSRSMTMDCEAWIKVCHVKRQAVKQQRKVLFGSEGSPQSVEPENLPDRRNLVIEVARGFASGDCIPCYFNGPKFILKELDREER